MLKVKADIKAQGSFAERKAARIAKGEVKYKFQVTARYATGGEEILASFSSKKEADDFAFRQIGPVVGNTNASRALWEKHSYSLIRKRFTFHVERIEATQ